MRVAAALLLVGACYSQPDYPPYTYDPGSNPGGGGDDGGGCREDADCGNSSLICARDYSCVEASETYTAHISWTISGKSASPATCASLPDLDLHFITSDDYYFGFSPIACDQGKFSIDKLPTWYIDTSIGPTGTNGVTASIDPTTGVATLDLPY